MPPKPKYQTPEAMQKAVDKYFADCEASKEILTVAGLALAIGFVDRQSMYDYRAKPSFTGVIKEAVSRIERYHESRLSGTTPTGSIFWLKNHKWSDTQTLSNPDGSALLSGLKISYEGGKKGPASDNK